MNIHMIGIGGAGMSGIAEVLARRGHSVTGSDLKESPYTRRLREAGITVYIGHAPDQVGDADRVVISTAIPKTNPELLQARRRSIPVIPRAVALAWILQGSRSVAVAGTHGKTTTTSMTAHVLEALGENPTALIGGELNDIGSNVAFGRSDLVVAEADESDRSFLYLRPQAAVVTNIEFDHPDFYSSLDDVVETFEQFVRSLPEDGHLVVCADDPSCLKVAAEAQCPVTTYGIGSGDLRADIVKPSSYVLFEDGERRGEVELGVYGRHNVLNSLAAAGVARWLGHQAYEAASTLQDFGGVRRRFQLKGEQAEVRVV
ncbi:MAG TPA: UDP-N-acetylmuramate--L-alanine ligase, partial [Rubrobacter sp.]|nr:UDP-N-acetylmuramate--L-alanine ligase [Rubrobacter sp.]